MRRINFFGGPGSGKSTIAAKVFSDLKSKHFDIELIAEYIKCWAYEGKMPRSYDQLYVFSKQLKAEDTALKSVNYVVTDSPLLLNAAYCKKYNFKISDQIIDICQRFPAFKPFSG